VVPEHNNTVHHHRRLVVHEAAAEYYQTSDYSEIMMGRSLSPHRTWNSIPSDTGGKNDEQKEPNEHWSAIV
jgi:hypothetical protein